MRGTYFQEQIDTYQRLRAEVFAEHPSEGGTTDLSLTPSGIMTVEIRRTRHAPLEIYLVDRKGEVIGHSTL